MIPSASECFKFMDLYDMPPHIRDHSVMVEKVASLLVSALDRIGVKLSAERVKAGALMHDIAKSVCLQTGELHSAKGKEICLQHHLEEIADIVSEHVVLKDYQPWGPIGEKEIVYYADKRVNHDAVVSLEERLQYLLERYAKGEERVILAIRKNFETCKEVEGKIFSRLPFGPESIAERLSRLEEVIR